MSDDKTKPEWAIYSIGDRSHLRFGNGIIAVYETPSIMERDVLVALVAAANRRVPEITDTMVECLANCISRIDKAYLVHGTGALTTAALHRRNVGSMTAARKPEPPEMVQIADGTFPAGTKVWHYNGGEEAFGFGVLAWDEGTEAGGPRMVAVDGGSAAIEAAYAYSTPEGAAEGAKRTIDKALAFIRRRVGGAE